ncbi:MAG TPA: GNAT family N-acetyltransferase [Caulobacteraceae bacterium]|jgi:L-amino acid N-acyltransferase YncA|nr:GNAT family N-acetyltransferase [Caulobacteraceae bacterium]
MTLVVRPAEAADAEPLTELINAIIARGGTTALEEPLTPGKLNRIYLTGPDVICCFVAVDADTGELAGFQTLGTWPGLGEGLGDIGTFTRIGGQQRGVGTQLFAATRQRARELGVEAINATIRADNTGGLAFYSRTGFVDHHVDKGVPLKSGVPVDRISKRFPLSELM